MKLAHEFKHQAKLPDFMDPTTKPKTQILRSSNHMWKGVNLDRPSTLDS